MHLCNTLRPVARLVGALFLGTLFALTVATCTADPVYAQATDSTYRQQVRDFTGVIKALSRNSIIQRQARRVESLTTGSITQAIGDSVDTVTDSIARRTTSATVRWAANGIDTTIVSWITYANPATPPPPRIIALSTGSLTFNAVEGDSFVDTVTVVLSNGGGNATINGLGYTLTQLSGATTWVTASGLSNGSTPDTLTIAVARGTLTRGTYTARVDFTGDSLTVTPPSSLGITLAVVGSPVVTPPPSGNYTPPAGIQLPVLPDTVPTGVNVNAACTDTLAVNATISNYTAASATRVLCLRPGDWNPQTVTRQASDSSGWVVIKTLGSARVQPGTRYRPNVHGNTGFATFRGSGSTAALSVHGSKIYITNVEFAPAVSATGILYNLVNLGRSAITSPTAQPTNIAFVGNYVRGTSTQTVRRCIVLNSQHTRVEDNYVDECHEKGNDSQAIWGFQGIGPYYIANNYLAGAGENIIFGGSTPQQGVVPQNVTITRNYVHTPPTWKGLWTKKNLFETKSLRYFHVFENIFDGSWKDGQDGMAFVLKVSTNTVGGGGCNWCSVNDGWIHHNLITNASSAFGVTGKGDGSMVVDSLVRRLAIEDNVTDSIFIGATGGGIQFTIQNNATDIAIRRNLFYSPVTVRNATTGTSFNNVLALRLTMSDNIFGPATYPIIASPSSPCGTWFPCVVNGTYSNNRYVTTKTLTGAPSGMATAASLSSAVSLVPLAMTRATLDSILAGVR